MSDHQKNLVIFGAVLLFLVAGMQACMKLNPGTDLTPSVSSGVSSGPASGELSGK